MRVYAIVIVTLMLSVPVYPQYSGGSGTAEDPYQIATAEDLMLLGETPNDYEKHFILTADIDLDPNLPGRRIFDRAVIAPDVNDATYTFEGIQFAGVFDGNNHRIAGLTVHDGGMGRNYLGLFGYISKAEVGNLGLVRNSVSGDAYVGGLAGINYDGSISNCYCAGHVNGEDYLGGLVSINTGNISNCHSNGEVNGVDVVGGLTGYNHGDVSDCYSTSDVNGVDDVGGLVGSNTGWVSDCYSIGDVNAVDSVGGLVGNNADEGGRVLNCFWNTHTQTHGVTGGIGSNHGTATNVHGLPTSQLHQQSTFTDWDFINVWNIGENQTYPYLRTVPAGDINKDRITNFLDLCIVAEQWMTDD